MKGITIWLGLSISLLLPMTTIADVVNIYSFRQSYLIEPILEEFTKETGIDTKVVFAKKGLVERIKREGKYSPVDVVLTSDFSKLLQLASQGLTQPIQPQSAELIADKIPSQYRDPESHWLALTKRVRNIYAAKGRVDEPETLTYESLALPQYKGKICTRSAKHPYNLGLISSMIAHHGMLKTEQWLQAVKLNLARKPQGNDRAQVKAIKEGLCDLSLGNSYYYGKMLADPKQKVWADAVDIIFPNQKDRGAHINVSGAAIAKYSPNKANANKLIEFLASEQAQANYSALNMEYPVNPNVAPSKTVSSWGEFKEDNIALTEAVKHRKAALQLIDKVKFDL